MSAAAEKSPMDTAIIIPVHNRCETTLRCLSVLRADGVFAWAVVFVVDGGSTDGTREKVKRSFPEVRLVEGSEALWWTGAIERGMRVALGEGARYVCWLNDDALPQPGACARLRRSAEKLQALVTGQCVTETGAVVYGGMRRRGLDYGVVEGGVGEPERVDACGGNFACMPAGLVEAAGYPDAKRFPHAFGDLDFSIRVSRRGLGVWVDAEAKALSRPNDLKNHASWLLGDIAVADIWRGLWKKSSYSYAPAHVRFLARHFGVLGLLYWLWLLFKRAAITVLRVLFPRRWLAAVWGRRSRAWREEQRLRSGSGDV